MARNDDVTLPAGAWTLITNSDVTALRVQNLGSGAVYIKARVGAGAVSSRAGSICLDSLAMLPATTPLADLFPGVEGASRVYALSDSGGVVSVSHA
ncbi:MAG TPA: hypothetical protein PKE59_00285 [Novosphingobium sp.]|jgi:hypothetical protein|nr:hypothetical protein [Novosphingobium sp.]